MPWISISLVRSLSIWFNCIKHMEHRIFFFVLQWTSWFILLFCLIISILILCELYLLLLQGLRAAILDSPENNLLTDGSVQDYSSDKLNKTITRYTITCACLIANFRLRDDLAQLFLLVCLILLHWFLFAFIKSHRISFHAFKTSEFGMQDLFKQVLSYLYNAKTSSTFFSMLLLQTGVGCYRF